MSDNTLVNEQATDAADSLSENQATAKTYSQEEVDNMMARMKGSLEKKLLKPYEDLGDPEELRNIRSEWDKKQQQEKGLFDSIWDKIKDLWPAGIGGVPGKTNPKTPGPEPIKPGGTPKTTPTPSEPPKGAEKASTMKSTLKALLPWVGPTIVAAGLDFAIEETAKYKEELEANPFDPKFDNIPYAQVLRGEKETVGKAGAENRKETFTKMRRGDVEEILKTLNAIEIFNAYGVYKQDLQDWLDKNPEPSAMISLKMQPLPEGPTEEELTAKRLAEEDREKAAIRMVPRNMFYYR